MKKSSQCAFGGITAAISVVIMFSTAIIPFMTYVVPALAGIFILLSVNETGFKWAFGIYASVSLLALLIIPDKEVAILYTVFFGYYPIFKIKIEKHFHIILALLIKSFVFLITISFSYCLMIKLIGLEIEEIDKYGLWSIPLLLGMGLIAFIFYDIVLGRINILYNIRFKKYFRRYFQ